jgi:hypothetical protein
MANDIRTVTLNPAGGVPEIEVLFGQAQVGVYRAFLWDTQAKNSTELQHGNNIDTLLDKFTVGVPANALAGRFASVEAVIQTATPQAGQLFSLTVLVRQDGSVVPGGIIQENGQFASNTVTLFEFMRFA